MVNGKTRKAGQTLGAIRLPATSLAMLNEWTTKRRLYQRLDNRAALKAVAKLVNWLPTLYLVDICTIGHIKSFLKNGVPNDEKLKNYIDQLRKRDLPRNGISLMPALMEKISDQRKTLDAEQLVAQASKDLAALELFFEFADIHEPRSFVESMIRSQHGEHVETLGPSYHEILKWANRQGLSDPVSSSRRLSTVKGLIEEASRLKISRVHPVVVTIIACIYGCLPARRVVNFKKRQEDFNVNNAIGDIQFLQRAETLRSLASTLPDSKSKYRAFEIVTDDGWLEGLAKCFNFTKVQSSVHDEGMDTVFTYNISPRIAFPDVFSEENINQSNKEATLPTHSTTAEIPNELVGIYKLLGWMGAAN